MSRTGGAGLAPAEHSNGNGNGHAVAESDCVRKCIVALEVLQSTLHREFSRYQQVEEEIAEARAALASAEAAAEQARLDSLHDELTGLPNRTYFLQQLDQALAMVGPQQELAVMFIDLDGFKLVNDTHGHLVGDALLRIVATRLVRAVRAEDTMSRLGGDEFACLVAGSSRDDLTHLAEKLYRATSQPVTVGALTLSVHPSIGIACSPVNGTSPEALLRCADEAMYYAKKHRLGFALHGLEVVTQISFRPKNPPGAGQEQRPDHDR